AAAGRFEVQRHALLVRVQQHEEPGVLALLVGQRQASGLAAGRLDLDDLGAEPREHLRAAGARLVLGEVEHANSLECLLHGVLSVSPAGPACGGTAARDSARARPRSPAPRAGPGWRASETERSCTCARSGP